MPDRQWCIHNVQAADAVQMTSSEETQFTALTVCRTLS